MSRVLDVWIIARRQTLICFGGSILLFAVVSEGDCAFQIEIGQTPHLFWPKGGSTTSTSRPPWAEDIHSHTFHGLKLSQPVRISSEFGDQPVEVAPKVV